MEQLFLFVSLYLISNVGAAVTSYGGIEEGQTRTIDCYFTEDRDRPGTVQWTLDGTVVTADCSVDPAAADIIEVASNCNGTSFPDAARYSFNILSLDRRRDFDSWVCNYPAATGGNDRLTIMYIEMNGTGTIDGDGRICTENEETLSLTAEIDCSYPVTDLLWCLQKDSDPVDDESRKCSDETGWWEGVFESEPAIDTMQINCAEYDPYVFRTTSTIEANVSYTDEENNQTLFVVYAEKDYFLDDATPENTICGRGIWKLLALVIVAVIAAIITLVLDGVYISTTLQNTNESMIKVLFVLAMIGATVSIPLLIASIATAEGTEWVLISCSILLILVVFASLAVIYFHVKWKSDTDDNDKTDESIEIPPKDLITGLKDLEVTEGSDAIFTCNTTANMTVAWSKMGLRLTNSKKYLIVQEDTSSSLTVRQCTLKDNGSYRASCGSAATEGFLKVRETLQPDSYMESM